jgi:hypothetical protein
MRDEYDFSDAIKNPYAKRLKKSITIRLELSTVAYFKGLAEELELPYQSLINLYLRDCAASKRKLKLTWKGRYPRAEPSSPRSRPAKKTP